MDDQGATSSWYALSALGFYPVDPSSQEYIIGSPLFDDASLDMGNGKTLRIVARNNSDTNVYIQSATLDGKPWNKRSEKRRVGKECVSPCRSRRSPDHSTKKRSRSHGPMSQKEVGKT